MASKGNRLERFIANAIWRWLIRRGWIVRLNSEDQCHTIVERDGATYDVGWRPLFGVRYGHTPVYRGPGEVRWPPTRIPVTESDGGDS